MSEELVKNQVNKLITVDDRVSNLEKIINGLVLKPQIPNRCDRHPRYVGIDLSKAIKCKVCLSIYADRTSRKHICGKKGYKSNSKITCEPCNRLWKSVNIKFN